jgi:hypothetical protein
MTDAVRRGMLTGFLSAMIALVVEFLLGTAVNLFVTIPTDHPGARPPEYFSGVAQSVTWAILHGHVLLILHASLGLLIVLSALGLLVQATRSRVRPMIVTTGIGFLGVLAAGFNGGSFLNYNEDFSSMLMAAFFAVAVLAYTVGLYITAQSERASAQPRR